AYYEPPGSQMLHHSSVFVRSHDFSPDTGDASLDWGVPQLSGKGRTAVGAARLIGSLADLPYVMAQVDQNLLVPQSFQALIWEALVPSILNTATLPRWWKVSPAELHAAALYQRAGEELVIAATQDEALRRTVLEILSDGASPKRIEILEEAVKSGRARE